MFLKFELNFRWDLLGLQAGWDFGRNFDRLDGFCDQFYFIYFSLELWIQKSDLRFFLLLFFIFDGLLFLCWRNWTGFFLLFYRFFWGFMGFWKFFVEAMINTIENDFSEVLKVYGDIALLIGWFFDFLGLDKIIYVFIKFVKERFHVFVASKVESELDSFFHLIYIQGKNVMLLDTLLGKFLINFFLYEILVGLEVNQQALH